jgi:hypothetical protein
MVLAENVFHSMLTLERRRAERSRKPFVLMLMDAYLENGSTNGILKNALDVIIASKRETDLAGWFKEGAILGVIFTEINAECDQPITDILRTKVETALKKHLGHELATKIVISLHTFPQSWDKDQSGWVVESKLYPDHDRSVSGERLPQAVKRTKDILGRVLKPIIALFPL